MINCSDIKNTNDKIIRDALNIFLTKRHANDSRLKIIPELGVKHGSARIDIAVVNGVLHGYEIKSDRDTLTRLPEQMKEYNAVFDKVTLVVGKSHLFEAINMIPEWWGVMIPKVDRNNKIIFYTIREPKNNEAQLNVSIARLLWREEALKILEERNEAKGFKSKPRGIIYEKLVEILDSNTLKKKVRNTLLVSREGWRPDVKLVLNGD